MIIVRGIVKVPKMTEEERQKEIQREANAERKRNEDNMLLNALISDYAEAMSKIEGISAKDIIRRVELRAGEMIVRNTKYN